MKKLMIVAAAAMGLAAFGDIESANTVGFTTMAAGKGKFIMLGAQFDEIGGGTKVQNLVAGVKGVPYDENGDFEKTAPQIQIPAGGGYQTFYYLEDGWYDDGTEEGGFKAGWCDGIGNITDYEVTPGVAIWLKSVGEDAIVNVSGEVPSVDEVEVECPEIFSMRANAFPTEIAINSDKMLVTDIAAVPYDEASEFEKTAPQIQIPFGGGYKTYYYLEDGWFDDGTEEGGFKAGWCDGIGNLTDATIPVAQGFWLKGVGSAFNVKFVR